MFNDEIEINGNKLTRKYIESLNLEERKSLIDPIFEYFRKEGFKYPDDVDKVKKEYKRLCEVEVDINSKEIYNNDSTATFICKFFCKSFYNATEKGKKNMIELFNDDAILKKVIQNRLGIDWYKQHGEDDVEAFPISYRQVIQGFRSMRLVPQISIFKPIVAKYLCMKYSNVGDVIYDFSAGFGGRMMGVASCDRKYIGVDPLTTAELKEMRDYLGLENCLLIDGISEEIKLEKNSIDLSFSSPPYMDQEWYSDDSTQAASKGEDYFYNIYWKQTLDNIYYALKPGKIFALNVKNVPKMVEMAAEKFGPYIDELYLRTVRSHLNKKGKEDAQKLESIYIFKK